MSKLKNLIRQTVAIQGELVSSTIRLPRELNDFVEEFAEQHAKSKQEILLTFLEEGINIAKEELVKMETDVPTVSCAFQLLNTNKGNSLEQHNMILEIHPTKKEKGNGRIITSQKSTYYKSIPVN